MSLITLIVVIVVVGLILWLVETYVPMPLIIKRILEAIVVLVLILWILQGFGLLGPLTSIKI
jgi:hypothetical protein